MAAMVSWVSKSLDSSHEESSALATLGSLGRAHMVVPSYPDSREGSARLVQVQAYLHACDSLIEVVEAHVVMSM